MSNASLRIAPSLYSRVNEYKRHLKWLHRFVLLYGVSGAVIWRYGEPLYRATIKLTGA